MNIKTAVVCGASGTVGSLTGGILAQNGIHVYFISRTRSGAEKGLQKAISQARSDLIAEQITCGDYDTLLAEACRQADWIIEAVAEDLDVKRRIYEQIDAYRRAGSVVSTLTSSLPLEQLPIGRSEDFQRCFLSTHFYNPPAKLTACEVCGTSKTDQAIVTAMAAFLRRQLRRKVVPVKPIAGFAGNRIAFVLFAWVTALVEQYGVEMVDYLIGPYTGRAMPPLATIDLVGLDIHAAIIRNLHANIGADAAKKWLSLPPYVQKMIENGQLGRKTKEKGGFYKKMPDETFAFLDPKTLDYIPPCQPKTDFVEKAKDLIHVGQYQQAFETIFSASDPLAEWVQRFLAMYIAYAYSLVGQVCDLKYGISPIDEVMTNGFNWASPSMIVWLAGGRKKVIPILQQFDLPVPQALRDDTICQRQPLQVGKYLVAK